MKSLWGQGNKYLRVKRNTVDISPKMARILLLSTIILIGIIFIASDVGLWNIWSAQKQLKNLQAQISEYERNNEYLTEEIEKLESDPFAIEKVAREKYGYLRPGERVYRIILLQADGKKRGLLGPTLDMYNGKL